MSRCAAALLATLVLIAGGPSTRPAQAEQPWEVAVERARREQDREIRSVTARGGKLAVLVKRYHQRLRNDTSALSHYLHGRILWHDKRPDDALMHMRSALKLSPRFHYADHALAVIYYEKKDFVRAVFHLDNVLRAKPDHKGALLLRAELHLLAGEFKQALARAERLYRADRSNIAALALMFDAYMGLGRFDQALKVAERLIAKSPNDPRLRFMRTRALLALERWREAETDIRALLTKAPKDRMLRLMLAAALFGQGDLKGSAKVLEGLVRDFPNEIMIRGQLADVLNALKRYAEAERELVVVLRLARKDTRYLPHALASLALVRFVLKKDELALSHLVELDEIKPLLPHLIDIVQQALARLGRHQDRIPWLERLLPYLKGRPEDKKALEKLIRALKAGAAAGTSGPLWGADDRLAELIERCQHPKAAVRRRALHQYYEANVPFVDPVIYHRHAPDKEPDAECRLWVVRILGSYRRDRKIDPWIVRTAGRYAGYALEDPDARVRSVAAEELGRIGSPAGLLYLIPYVQYMRPDQIPTDPDERKSLEAEYNAARLALVALTGRRDTEIGDSEWIPLSKAAANRKAWLAWLDTADGVKRRLAGLADLAAVTDILPRWHLRYILVDIVKIDPPSPDAVSLEAYRVLRDRVRALGAEKIAADPWWRTFPMYDDKTCMVEHLPGIRRAIRVWYRDVPRKKPPTKGAAPAKRGGK